MKKIAILIENSRAYGRALIEGIAAFAQEERQPWILRPLTADEATLANMRRFDGLVARVADEKLAGMISRSGRPAVDVFCQSPFAGLAGVDSDHRLIGRTARSFFESRGFRNFAYCGFPGITFSDAREKAFADATTLVYSSREKNRSDEAQFYNERFDRIPDASSLARWLKTLPMPVAVFCCNDFRAIQLQRVALQSGLRIPQNLAILGVDNDTIACSFAEVPISSIDPNAFEIGKRAARILTAILKEKPARKVHRIYRVRPGEIIERSSTEFMPVDPPWLGSVLLHIERNMSHPVTASDIFALAGRSSTFVENVFRDKLGMSVQVYVTSAKMREAKRLLTNPDLRISEIAYACGFSSPQYFCRTFTSFFGSNPTLYRTMLQESPDYPSQVQK